MDTWLILELLVAALLAMMAGGKAEMVEYCFPQIFNQSCGAGEVMLIEAARYGRMKKGRCLTSDYHIGCWADVLPQVDRMCSGRRSCQINIPDTTLHMLQPCPKDLFTYLEASFLCVRVENLTNPHGCRQHQDLPLYTPSGYLSSSVTQQQGFGSPTCPWKVSLPPGQRINLTLYDFGVAARYTQQGANMCHVYAKVQERGLPSDVTICGSTQRKRGVYVSETNTLEIQMMSAKKEPDPAYFLIHYEAIGCTNPVIPAGAWLKRTENKAVVACNHTSQTWHIVCRGNSWIGTIDNCTQAYDSAGGTDTLTETKYAFPFGLLVAIIAGVILGIFIGVALLAVVMFCHKKRPPPYQPADDNYMTHSREQQNPFLKPDHSGTYGYTHVCTLRNDGSTLGSTEHKPACSCRFGCRSGDIYEKPSGLRTCHIHVDVKHSDGANNSNLPPPPPPQPQIPSFYGDYDGTNSLDIVRMTDHQQGDNMVDYNSGGEGVRAGGVTSYLESPVTVE